MNETNGLGAVVPVGWMRTIAGLYRRAEAWLRPHAAPPQESDKGEVSLDAQAAYIAELHDRIATLESQLAEARAEVEALREEVALTNEHEHQILQERNEARDELATARAALLAYQEALRSAVSEARPALWCYPSGVLEYACPFCGEGTMRKRDDPQPQTVADIKHRDGCFVLVARPAPDVVPVPREEWEEYQTAKAGFRFAKGWTMICTEDLDALRSSAQAERAGAADVVTVPREIIAALGRVAQEAAWLRHGRCRGYEDLWDGPLGEIDEAINALDALRSSAQAERAGAADVVTVPREEWEALRALFAAAGRAIHAASTGERATLEEINDAWAGVCSAQVALRSSAQGGKDGG